MGYSGTSTVLTRMSPCDYDLSPKWKYHWEIPGTTHEMNLSVLSSSSTESSAQGQVLLCKHRNQGCSSAEGRSSTANSGTKLQIYQGCAVSSRCFPHIRPIGRWIRNINKDGRTDGVRRLRNIWQNVIMIIKRRLYWRYINVVPLWIKPCEKYWTVAITFYPTLVVKG